MHYADNNKISLNQCHTEDLSLAIMQLEHVNDQLPV